MSRNLRKGGTIERWLAVTIGTNPIITGVIYGDEDWPDGSSIRTSIVVTGTFLEGQEVETLNTTYTLGVPFDAPITATAESYTLDKEQTQRAG